MSKFCIKRIAQGFFSVLFFYYIQLKQIDMNQDHWQNTFIAI